MSVEIKVEDEIKKSLKPVVFLTKIVGQGLKNIFLDQFDPIPPGGAPSIGRKILEKLLTEAGK